MTDPTEFFIKLNVKLFYVLSSSLFFYNFDTVFEKTVFLVFVVVF